jgi:hypothetical protein
LGELPNFKNYGVAARQLAKDLIEDARGTGDVTIQSVLKMLQLRLTQGREVVLAEMRVKFDSNGDVLNGQEHVYEQGPEKAWHSVLCSCGGPLSNKTDSVTGH